MGNQRIERLRQDRISVGDAIFYLLTASGGTWLVWKLAVAAFRYTMGAPDSDDEST